MEITLAIFGGAFVLAIIIGLIAGRSKPTSTYYPSVNRTPNLPSRHPEIPSDYEIDELPYVTANRKPDYSPTRNAPLLARDVSSQLRAKGMQSLYSNWRSCYFDMGKPYGQSVEAEVELIPEPNNQYDANAVAVVCEGWVLGYIPAELALSLKTLINSAGGVVRADAELWFDFRTRTQKRNSVRLLVARPFRIQAF